MKEETLKQNIQKRILLFSCLILIGKFIAYRLTNSIGILTDAMESIVNVVAGAISLFCLYWAARPKDKGHPFGHGKIELISASIEGILISIAGILIVYEGICRLLHPGKIESLDIGIYIIAGSGVINFLLGMYSIRTGKKCNSIALIAGGKHLQSDTYSTIGLVCGLLIVHLTGLTWIDCALALIFGSGIIITGISILRKTVDNLLDRADEELLKDLTKTFNEKRISEWIDIHNVKVLKSGNFLYMDCDLTIPWYYNIDEGHRSGEKFKHILQEKYADRIQLTIHLDPCNIFNEYKCCQCPLDCQYRKLPFKEQQEITPITFVQNETENASSNP